MSTVFVHIGQCGNQLSIPLWKNLLNYCERTGNQVFKSLDQSPRSVHIDSEPKVVNMLPKQFKVRDKNIIVGKRGRGTNFALGYYGMRLTGDDHILEECIEAVRKEVERCDMYSGAIVFHSLSGGTGSGLGSHVIETIREEFPCHHLMSCAVAPCATGESPLQNYNALLTLHWLQSYTDAIVLLQNDYFIKRLNHAMQMKENSQVSFQLVNKSMASHLCGIFQPTDTLAMSKGFSIGQEPWEVVRTLTPMPATKFVSISQHQSSKLSWEGLVSKTLHHHAKHLLDGSPTSSLSATVVARGDVNNTFLSDLRLGLDKKIKKGLRTVDWNPYPVDCWTSKDNFTTERGSGSSVTIAANSSCVLDHINTVLSQSMTKLQSGAYLHWYERYGLSQDLFEESLETLQTIVSEYKEVTRT